MLFRSRRQIAMRLQRKLRGRIREPSACAGDSGLAQDGREARRTEHGGQGQSTDEFRRRRLEVRGSERLCHVRKIRLRAPVAPDNDHTGAFCFACNSRPRHPANCCLLHISLCRSRQLLNTRAEPVSLSHCMNHREHPSSDSERESHASDTRPPKRARRSSPHDAHGISNGNGTGHGDHERERDREDGNEAGEGGSGLPLLSPSIIGVEPLDEFIREIADFIHYHIYNRPQDAAGAVEVEAKIGVLRERGGDQRLQLPVLVETSALCSVVVSYGCAHDAGILSQSVFYCAPLLCDLHLKSWLRTWSSGSNPI